MGEATGTWVDVAIMIEVGFQWSPEYCRKDGKGHSRGWTESWTEEHICHRLSGKCFGI